MKLAKVLLSTIKKYWVLLILGILAAALSMSISLGIPFISQAIIDDGIFANNARILLTLSILMIVLYIVDYFIKLLSSYVFTKISKEYTKNIYLKVLENIAYKKHQFFVENNSGELLQRISEVWNLEDTISEQLFDSALSIITFFIAIGVLFSMSIPITILVLCSVVIIAISYYFGNRLMGKLMPQVLDKNAQVTSKLQEVILGIFEIRSTMLLRCFTKRMKQ